MRLNVKSERKTSACRTALTQPPNVGGRSTRSRGGVWLTVMALATLVALTSHPPVEAAPTTFRLEARPLVRSTTPETFRIAQAEMAPRSADEWAACYRVRKRLWAGDEGWVVRRVTACR